MNIKAAILALALTGCGDVLSVTCTYDQQVCASRYLTSYSVNYFDPITGAKVINKVKRPTYEEAIRKIEKVNRESALSAIENIKEKQNGLD